MTEAAHRMGPYVGLVPYSEDDWEFFVGREAETELIIANLEASRLTLLYGASGVGKSSVLRAGVVHRLDTLGRENRATRGSPELAVAVFSGWRDDPVAGLARRVRDAVARATGREPGPLPGPGGLAEAFGEWAALAGGDLFVILDQFEEYFLYHGREDGEGSFATEFPKLVNRQGLRVNFLLSIREDGVARLDRFKGRIPYLFDNYLRLHHLGLDAAEHAIREPLARFNRRYPDEAMEIEEGLVREVLRQTRSGQVRIGHAGAGIVAAEDAAAVRIETPYLQMVMTRLWEEERASRPRVLRLDTFTNPAKLGGADSIVRTHLDREMAKLSPGEGDVAAAAFRYLVTRTGSKIALGVEDLAEYAEFPAATLAGVLEKLAEGERRILRPVPVPDRPDATRYEIFHDVLGPAIADWRRRHEAEREQEAIREEQEQRRREELEAAEALREKDRGRFMKIGVAVLSVGIVLLLGALGVAWQQRDQAIGAQKAEEKARVQAESERERAESARAQAQKAREDAEQARQRAEEESRLARLAIADPGRAARQVDARAQAGIEARAQKSGEAAGKQLRDAFLTANAQTIEDTAVRLGLLNEKIRFRAARYALEGYVTDLRQIYQFSLWPVPESVPGGLQGLSAVTYKMNHPSFKNKLLEGNPRNGFRAYYVGWGSLNWVPVLLEYKDPARPPEVALFAMTDKLETAGDGSGQ